jgi:2-polyprenyl-3-methyl-5-hydroxy-6-metoxy-1,4-benzoquinol methylase
MSIASYGHRHVGAQAEDTAQKETRFSFGENWARFLDVLNEDRIASAEVSLCRMLGLPSLAGKRFLDVGSGSGLFSLAAHRLGARVHSFDLDPQSVACTKELRRRYAADAGDWRIEQHSALDADYLSSLGSFDIVYSWGVLHHTGAMWQALNLVHRPVVEGGLLFLAIYNDTGTQSARWLRIKRLYNRLRRRDTRRNQRCPTLVGDRQRRAIPPNMGLQRIPRHEPVARHPRLDRRVPL